MSLPLDSTPDAWSHLRPHTPARIALGRAGSALPTRAILAFSADHAAARDAVHEELDTADLIDSLNKTLPQLTRPPIIVRSAATTRAEYLRRPDLGRKLSADSVAALRANHSPPATLAITIADGLSAAAAQHAAPLLAELLPLISSVTLAPLIVATGARVALADDIASSLHPPGPQLTLILLGERPGLSSPDALGAYLTYRRSDQTPTDADRNCVSNIRPEGLAYRPAAETLAFLIHSALDRRLTGIALKDDRSPDRSLDSPAHPAVNRLVERHDSVG